MMKASETRGVIETSSWLEFLAQARRLTEAELDRLLPAESIPPQTIHAAIRWSVFAGGKRFRPALLLASGQTFGAGTRSLLTTGCALEMIHTYSLVHDDLPSMDDDDLRRGRPTCHVRFGEATAILAGDALLTLAFNTVATDEHLNPETRVRVIAEASRAAGTPHGMVAGQACDLEAESRDTTAGELENIHRLKTAALITAAGTCGAIIAGADQEEVQAINEYAGNVGLLFQITDDLLDITSSVEAMGKTPGKDERSRKATYPALYGIESTREHLTRVHDAACSALAKLNRPTGLLREIADYIVERDA